MDRTQLVQNSFPGAVLGKLWDKKASPTIESLWKHTTVLSFPNLQLSAISNSHQFYKLTSSHRKRNFP